MSMFQLFWKELWHRRWSSLAAAAVVATTTGLIVAVHLLGAAYQEQTAVNVARLDDEIRKAMKELGFNIFILPKDLNLSQFFRQDFGSETMPQELVDKLANSRDVVTINHLRPALIRKADWPEQNRQIILMGVSGVVPWAHRQNPKQPLAQAVPPGEMHLGNLLAKDLGVNVGETVAMQGRSFHVGKIYPGRGNEDDITAWIDLATAQEMAGLPNRVNMIQALECNCASIDRLAEIEQEISSILGSEVKVLELSTEAIARAQARVEVEASGKQNVALLKKASLIGFSLVTVLGSVILALMFLRNASQRLEEIGMLRAIGVSRNQLLGLFLGKSLALGVVGGTLGLLIGYACAISVGPRVVDAFQLTPPDWKFLCMVPTMTTLITLLATWIPIEAVTGRDPASILREAS